MNPYSIPGCNVTDALITSVVSESTGITVELMESRTRKRIVVRARQLRQTLLFCMTRHTLEKVGLITGRYDHATVMSSIKTVNDLYDTSKEYRQFVDRVLRRLNTTAEYGLQKKQLTLPKK